MRTREQRRQVRNEKRRERARIRALVDRTAAFIQRARNDKVTARERAYWRRVIADYQHHAAQPMSLELAERASDMEAALAVMMLVAGWNAERHERDPQGTAAVRAMFAQLGVPMP